MTSLLDDIVERVELYGRFQANKLGDEYGFAFMWNLLLEPLYGYASSEPIDFSQQLATLVFPVGAWAVYGGERLTWKLTGMAAKNEYFYQILDAALKWYVSEDSPQFLLVQYELDRQVELRLRGEL